MINHQDQQAFYSEFTERNSGFISLAMQERLSTLRVLVAGAGSTGGAVCEPLVRAGVQHLAIADNGCYELNNLNRQRATTAAIGTNKATWISRTLLQINPFVETIAITEGVTEQNVDALLQSADLIIDAIDVTTMQGLSAKALLHEKAARSGHTVISAYDLGFRQYIRIFDYSQGDAPLGGKFPQIRNATTPMDALAQLIPVSAIPLELAEEIKRLIASPGSSISQLGCTADLFGALIVPIVMDIIEGTSRKKAFIVDLRSPRMSVLQRSLRRARVIAILLPLALRARMRHGK